MILDIVLLLLFSQTLHARPEYALRHNVVDCTACHMSPTGGGIRNANGKAYGSHGHPLLFSPTQNQWFHLDYRLEAFQAKNKSTRKGLFTMTTIPAVNIPVQLKENEPPAMNFIASYGLGRLDTGLGYTYLRYNIHDQNLSWFKHAVIGRFNKPFGLITDEHRNFTKVSFPSSTRDYETGFMISGTPRYSFHYDLAATNGTQGDQPAVDDSPWALYLNTRFMPYLGPVMFGASYARHGTHASDVKLQAYNTYALFSIEKVTTNKIPVVLISEIQWTEGWNNSALNSGMSNFISPSFASWQTALTDSKSQTLLLESDWNITQKWVAMYRFEQFIPDTNFTGDQFKRHSYGLKYFLNAHSSLWARYERAHSTRPGVTEDGTARFVGESAFLLFHFWL